MTDPEESLAPSRHSALAVCDESFAGEKKGRLHHAERKLGDAENTEQRQHDEPDERDGTEEHADASRAPVLYGKERDQNDDRDGDHVRLKERGCDFQALDGTQYGDCRRDHAVAVQERRSEESGQH